MKSNDCHNENVDKQHVLVNFTRTTEEHDQISIRLVADESDQTEEYWSYSSPLTNKFNICFSLSLRPILFFHKVIEEQTDRYGLS